MRFLIIGGGSIGRRHLENLLGLSHTAYVVEPARQRANEIEERYGVRAFHNLEEALKGRYDAALVCNPTIYHARTALLLAEAKTHLFIEKPVSHDLKKIDCLLNLVKKNRLRALVGYNFKFHPSFKLMKTLLDSGAIGKVLSFTVIAGQYLPDWHPYEDYRKGYSANRSLGGGALLDSHELAYLQWFLGPIAAIACAAGKYSSLEIDTEDTAEMIVRTKGGATGNVHVDYIQHPYRRIYYFYGSRGALEWDKSRKVVSLYRVKDKRWRYFKEPKDYDSNQMYIDEMKHFTNVLKEKEESVTDISSGIRTLKVMLAAKRASKLKRFIDLTPYPLPMTVGQT